MTPNEEFNPENVLVDPDSIKEGTFDEVGFLVELHKFASKNKDLFTWKQFKRLVEEFQPGADAAEAWKVIFKLNLIVRYGNNHSSQPQYMFTSEGLKALQNIGVAEDFVQERSDVTEATYDEVNPRRLVYGRVSPAPDADGNPINGSGE